MRTTLSHLSDAELMQLVADRQHDALAEAYRRHSGPVLGLASRLIRDRTMAEEVVQLVMLKLWTKPEGFDETRGSLRSYLLASTHGRSVDLIRSESARRTREEREGRLAVHIGLSLDDEVWQMAQAEHVRGAVKQLDQRERRPIELAYFGGYTYREVARLLDTPEGTIKSRIRTGLQRLGVLLATTRLAEVS